MKVSIVCPLYNSRPHLKATIDSIKAQTMSDFEVIIVDDQSTDGSLEFARQYAGDDMRFRFLQTPRNSGPGVVRNIGIDAAEGDYIAFIDSDDRYHHDFLRSLVDAAGGNKDLSYCQLQCHPVKGPVKTHHNPVVPDGVFTERSKKYFLMYFVTFAVCFIYRREFLCRHNLRFPELSNSEDTNFLIKNILLAETIACVDEPLYYYMQRPGSLTAKRSKKRWQERFQSLNMMVRDFNEMKSSREYSCHHLGRYTLLIYFLWLKKGLLLSIIDLIKYFTT